MRKCVAVLVSAIALVPLTLPAAALAGPATRSAQAMRFAPDYGMPGNASLCQFAYTRAAKAACIRREIYRYHIHMSRGLRACLIAVGVSSFGVGVGGLITGFAAREIAGAVAGGGASGCLGALLAS